MDALTLTVLGNLTRSIQGLPGDKNGPSYKRYAFILVKNEQEALPNLKSALSQMYDNLPSSLDFDEGGDLVKEIEASGLLGGLKRKKETDPTISYTGFKKQGLLKLELFDECDMEPWDDTVMLAKYLTDACTSRI